MLSRVPEGRESVGQNPRVEACARKFRLAGISHHGLQS